jgi:alpha-methylacyl-CoA racemase
MAGALEGVRIVEFAGLGPVPFAAMMLADMGADIVRIERPDASPVVPDPITGRGRPRIAVDLKEPGQRAEVARLIQGADALIEGFRPGVMERLGLGPDGLIASNPRLVYGRMTGWGQDGPLANRAGHDINYIAITGALAAIGPEERCVPPLSLIGDYGGGALYLVAGVLAGILSARRTGQGQVIDCAMCDGAVSLLSLVHEMAADGQWQARRAANMLDGGAPYYGVYRCSDGLDLAIGAIEPQFYSRLCAGLGLDEPSLPDRGDRANWPALRRIFAAHIATRPRGAWLARLEGDSCVSPVLPFDAAAGHPHLAARQSFVIVDDVPQPAPAPRFSRTISTIRPERRRSLTIEHALAAWGQAPV